MSIGSVTQAPASQLSASDAALSAVFSGLITPASANRIGVMSPGAAYVQNARVFFALGDARLTATYPPLSDTYTDIDDSGNFTRSSVTNNAAAPAVTANSIRIEMVVTSGTAITSVVRLAADRSLVMGKRDPVTGNITALVNPVTGNNFPLAKSPSANTLAVIGDSITKLASDVTAGGRTTNNAGYLTWALALSGQRLTVISDQSQGGSGVTNTGFGTILSTQLTAAIASGAQHVLMMACINDILLTSPVPTVDDLITEFRKLINRAISAGMTVWWCTVPPIDSTWGSYSVLRQGKIHSLNARIRYIAATEFALSSIYVVDMYKTLVNPLSATGNGFTGWSVDGEHPTNVGARPMGVELARLWNLYVPEAPQLLTSAADNYVYSTESRNLVENGLFTAGVAPGTGFAVSSPSGGATSTNTLVARADGFGNDLQMAITFPAAGSYEVRINNYKTRIAEGDKIIAACEITVSAPVNIFEPRLTVDMYTSGGTSGTYQDQSTFAVSPNSSPITTGYTAQLRAEPIEYTLAKLGGINSSSIYLTVQAAAAGSATVKIGRLSLNKIKAAV